METAVCVNGFFLLIFFSGAHLSPDPHHVFGHEGGSVYLSSSSLVDYTMLYRVTADGDLLLVNCSQPEGPQPEGYDVECVGMTEFVINNLTMFQSGDYKVERWKGGNTIEHSSYRLIVSAEYDDEPSRRYVTYNDSDTLCRLDSTVGNVSSLQLYRVKDTFLENILVKVLDTNSSLEPLVDDLRGRLLVDLNNFQITLTGLTHADNDIVFYCTVWRGAQCQSYSKTKLIVSPKLVFAHDEENVTLPCISKGQPPGQVRWYTHTGDVVPTINHTHKQEVMYVLNSSQTGDYSLIIPSMSQQHSGGYRCKGHDTIKDMILFLCTKVSHLDLVFSHAESVCLEVTPHLNISHVVGIQWYRQKVLEPQILILDSLKQDHVILPEDLKGRVIASNISTNHSLIISNLTAEGSGVYTWRVYGRLNFSLLACSEGSIRLAYRDLLGVHSLFYRVYAPMIGCVLLGLVATVIWFKLRSRKGEQTSGHQRREGQQCEDEDLYDDVEMAEDSV